MSNEKICNVKFCQLIRVASILYAPAIWLDEDSWTSCYRTYLVKPRGSILGKLVFKIWKAAYLDIHLSKSNFHFGIRYFRTNEKKELSEPSLQKIYTHLRKVNYGISQYCFTATVPPYCLTQYKPVFSAQHSVATPWLSFQST